jgi:hypothetical protein
MVDILFLAHKRPEFTRTSLESLLRSGIADARFWILTDGDQSISRAEAGDENAPDHITRKCNGVDSRKHGGPVACLNALLDLTSDSDILTRSGSSPEATSEFIAKIDNDTIVPPGWLPACLDLMRRYPNVDLLGIEPWTPDEKLFPRWPFPMATAPFFQDHRSVRPVSHIGGIGVFRRSAFERFGRPVPNSQDGRYGFTEWQWANPGMVKAFIDPPLPVFLLDHLPFGPWADLSDKYEREGVQRNVGWKYDAVKHRALWEWWLASRASSEQHGVDVGGTR